MAELQVAVLKGNPWRYHLKSEGAWAAICGHSPGKRALGSSHRSRTGWLIYNKSKPNQFEKRLCERCAAISKEHLTSTKDGE